MGDRTRRPCRFDGCGEPHYSKGWCRNHYDRWKRHGDPEAGKRRSVHERFWSKVDKAGPVPAAAPDLGPCWIWTSAISDSGYGVFGVNGRNRLVHRYSYEQIVGTIPEGLQLDHLCRVRICLHPEHLEPVSARVNTLRGKTLPAINARKTHCGNGHPFDRENTWIDARGHRHCRACARDRQRTYAQDRRENQQPKGNFNTQKTHCVRGHLFDEANTGFAKDGHRFCRPCKVEWTQAWRARQRPAS
jgi:hypothetical protein